MCAPGGSAADASLETWQKSPSAAVHPAEGVVQRVVRRCHVWWPASPSDCATSPSASKRWPLRLRAAATAPRRRRQQRQAEPPLQAQPKPPRRDAFDVEVGVVKVARIFGDLASIYGTRLSAGARVVEMCSCTWVRCCFVFSVLFGGLLSDREVRVACFPPENILSV